MTTCVRVFCTSTTGDAPVTVTFSSTAPTSSAIFTCAANAPSRMMPWRRTVLKPVNENVTVYVPGRKFSIEYRPAPSDTTERDCSIKTGLAASTVTPGSTAPDESCTRPEILARSPCARTGAATDSPITHANATRAQTTTRRMLTPYLRGLEVNTLRPRSCQFKMTVNFGACSCSNARAKELATMRTSFWSTALVALAVVTAAAQDQPARGGRQG